jgi:hypothetical protein
MRSAVADRAIAQRLFGKLLFFFFGLGLMEDNASDSNQWCKETGGKTFSGRRQKRGAE